MEETETILEREAFLADERDIMQHPLVLTTERFLAEHMLGMRGGSPVTKSTGSKDQLNSSPSNSLALNSSDPSEQWNVLLISLSGGNECVFVSLFFIVAKT